MVAVIPQLFTGNTNTHSYHPNSVPRTPDKHAHFVKKTTELQQMLNGLRSAPLFSKSHERNTFHFPALVSMAPKNKSFHACGMLSCTRPAFVNCAGKNPGLSDKAANH